MYSSYFGLKEKPFKLVPNPDFLFLGKCHEEVLAHLTYATTQGDGFVAITGEVGTGKTTLCRTFLEDLGRDVEAAFIFNSKLDAAGLLKAIHKELGILTIANGPVELTQDLNDYLLEKKSQGKSVILLIDEAQNLAKDTLEQLRLLSNLETTRSKLLQIVLVGQPELREILDSYEMRQLKQRINLNYHMRPMTQQETDDYITHRVNVALRKPKPLFTPAAMKLVYRHSRGIPRLINILCDRSLLVAFSLDRKNVTPVSISAAIEELNLTPPPPSWSDRMSAIRLPVFLSVLLILALVYMLYTVMPPVRQDKTKADHHTATPLSESEHTSETPYPAPVAVVEQVAVKPEPLLEEAVKPSLPVVEKKTAIEILSALRETATRENAFIHMMSLWQNGTTVKLNPLVGQITSNMQFFKIAAAQNGLHILHLKGHHDMAEKFNLPVIFECRLPGDPDTRFLGVERLSEDGMYVIFPGAGETVFKVAPEELKPYLNQNMYIAWKDNFGYDRVIAGSASEESIQSLKLLLSEMGYGLPDMTPVYDESVKQAVKQIQKKYGLTEDGLVGPLTKIMLLNEKEDMMLPYLMQNPEEDLSVERQP